MSNYNKNPLDRILTTTIEGLQNGDLTGLNDAIEESVNTVLNSVGDKLGKLGDIKTNGNAVPLSQYRAAYANGEETKRRLAQLNEEKNKRAEQQRKEAKKRAELELQRKNQANKNALVKLPSPFNPVGKVSSVLYMTGGGIGIGASALSLIGRAGQFVVGKASLGAIVLSGVFLAISLALTNTGIIQKKRLDRARRYTILIGNKQYMDISQLASATNQSQRKITSDLKKMLKKGFFPQGHIDNEKTTIMLSDSVYSEYMKSLEGRKAISGANKEVVDTTARQVDDNPELTQMIAEGTDYINKLHAINMDIPGVTITAKLDRLETILKEIFLCVKKHPEQMPRMHEVMNYYLPTVMKLLEAYKEYDNISEADEEILSAKTQIEGSIDKINGALRKILNNLFRDSVWDVTTDATVLNTMLTQKGLVSQFDETNNN